MGYINVILLLEVAYFAEPFHDQNISHTFLVKFVLRIWR